LASHETDLTVVIIQCYFGRSHETGLTVVIIQCYFGRSHETCLTVVIIQCYFGVTRDRFDCSYNSMLLWRHIRQV
jgi:hypothetical protein